MPGIGWKQLRGKRAIQPGQIPAAASEGCSQKQLNDPHHHAVLFERQRPHA